MWYSALEHRYHTVQNNTTQHRTAQNKEEGRMRVYIEREREREKWLVIAIQLIEYS